MPQLIVRQIEDRVVKKLKQQAGAHGVSMEEEHRRILRESLLGRAAKGISYSKNRRELSRTTPRPSIAPWNCSASSRPD